jgi:NAD(P)-dependent dehydrogenase (short-subunit alcohol dehydrogenase family)
MADVLIALAQGPAHAGIAGPTKPVEDVTRAELDAVLQVDLASMFHCARRAVPALRSAGGGSIVNIASAAGRFGFRLRSPYSAAKWGVVGFTKRLVQTWAGRHPGKRDFARTG